MRAEGAHGGPRDFALREPSSYSGKTKLRRSEHDWGHVRELRV